MSTATWGELELPSDDAYPITLLKQLLQQMMAQFSATGACLALYDESIEQMVVRLHVRLPNTSPYASVSTPTATSPSGPLSPAALSPAHTPFTQNGLGFQSATMLSPGSGRRTTVSLPPLDPSSSAFGRLRRELEDVSPQQSDIFSVGTTYPLGHDLIGYVWQENKAACMRFEEYSSWVHKNRPQSFSPDVTPSWLLAVPIPVPMLSNNPQARNLRRLSNFLGVVILYQTAGGPGFPQKQKLEAQQFAERIALYLENDRLQRAQRRSSEHMLHLQQVSAAFPTTVLLSNLVEDIYRFVLGVVDASSLLLTFYDRDTKKIYDVFAVRDGQRVEALPTSPRATDPAARPGWSRVALDEKRTLSLAPTQLKTDEYDELLEGAWGDQRQAESFLLLPMKMFNRVVGSLSLSSKRPNAYQEEEIQVLETMVQIVTVSIENAKLYNRDRQSLRESRQRQESLAAMNSALQAISSVLDVSELLRKFVEFVVKLVGAELCIFFQLTKDKEELVAQTMYSPPQSMKERPSDPDLIHDPLGQQPQEELGPHSELMEMVRLPFKGTVLESLVTQGVFFKLEPSMIEELASKSGEGGTIFLQMTDVQRLLMIPVQYQTELMGILAVHTPKHLRMFHPKEVGVLLAICSQAATALSHAQLFEELQETNVELQRMNTLKDEFLVTASHELRTPLSAILGYTSMLKRHSARNDPQQMQRYIGKISSAAQQLSGLVVSMTEAASIGVIDKKLDLQMSAVEMRSAVEMAIAVLGMSFEQKVTLQIPPDLWMKGDPLRVRQVISNLLDNAAKYSPLGGQIEIIAKATTLLQLPLSEEQRNHAASIDYGNDAPVILVSLRDEGEGILPEDQERIFEKFVRAPRSLTTTVRGTGLGLYISRRYIEAMGGKLWLEQSIPGEGSVFSFYLLQEEQPTETGAGGQVGIE